MNRRRKIAGGILVTAGVLAIIIGLVLPPMIQPAATIPPPSPGGNSHGGSGGTTPPCTTSCTPPTCTMNCTPPQTDTQAPTTTIKINGPLAWNRTGVGYYYPNFTITLTATDDENISRIILNDTGTITTFAGTGNTTTVTTTITTAELHTIWYYSNDTAGNKETPQLATVGLAVPDASDLESTINNSRIDNAGIKNAMDAKVRSGALNALSNQLNALDGKHGLDQATVDLLQAMITAITSNQNATSQTAGNPAFLSFTPRISLNNKFPLIVSILILIMSLSSLSANTASTRQQPTLYKPQSTR